MSKRKESPCQFNDEGIKTRQAPGETRNEARLNFAQDELLWLFTEDWSVEIVKFLPTQYAINLFSTCHTIRNRYKDFVEKMKETSKTIYNQVDSYDTYLYLCTRSQIPCYAYMHSNPEGKYIPYSTNSLYRKGETSIQTIGDNSNIQQVEPVLVNEIGQVIDHIGLMNGKLRDHSHNLMKEWYKRDLSIFFKSYTEGSKYGPIEVDKTETYRGHADGITRVFFLFHINFIEWFNEYFAQYLPLVCFQMYQ